MDDEDTRWRPPVGGQALRVLTLPGWQGSGPGHWQTRWEQRHGFRRVEQADWQWPRRGDWMARLEDVVLADAAPALLVAHSLGCHLVAAWAAHSAHARRVAGALLVAPPDVARAELPPQLHNWRRETAVALPFAATVLYSDDDPYVSADAARSLASRWGATAVALGRCGHVNADAGLGDWPRGLAALQALAEAALRERPAP